MGIKIAPLLIILFAVSTRILPHPANFTAIGAVALFSASYLPKKYAFIIPLSAMFLSDLIIGFYGVTMFYVYGSFILTGIVGLYLRTHKKLPFIICASFLSSILFYLITNFGVWMSPNSFYPRSFPGLIECYTLALPFFRNTLAGDSFYTLSLFYGYSLIFNLSKKYFSEKIFRLVF